MRAPVLVLPLLFAASSVPAATLHVCPDGSGDYATLQVAVDAASSGDTIELCAGTFTGPENVDLDFGSKSLTLMSPYGYAATVVDFSYIPEGEEESASHAGILLGPGTTTRIEGVTLRRAMRRNPDTGELEDGGAIQCANGSVTLDRVHIEGRYHDGAYRGAGVFLGTGSLEANDCLFEGNAARGSGGAIYIGDAHLTLRRSTFGGNSGCQGAVVSVAGDAWIEDCVFSGNCCGCGDGGSAQGTPVSIRAGTATVLRCTFSNNPASAYGGLVASAGTEVLLDGCVFDDCSSEVFGAALATFGTATIRNTMFKATWGAVYGAAVETLGTATFEHCIFLDNRLYSGVTLRAGGVTSIDHCSFVGNGTGQNATAILIDIPSGADVTIRNSILAFGGEPGHPQTPIRCNGTPANLAISCTDIFGNEGGDWVGCIAGMEASNGNLSADPLLCGRATGDLTLRGDSPCAPDQSGECGLIGAFDVGCGSTAIQPSSWGCIKALYR